MAATIDATRTAPSITKLVFGGFMEPATTSVWAEMLADRKFFAEITSKPNNSVPTGGFGRRGPQRRWVPVGPDTFVAMDRTSAYVGEWSPVVRLEPATPHVEAQVERMVADANRQAASKARSGAVLTRFPKLSENSAVPCSCVLRTAAMRPPVSPR